jgi:hypothetical protein
VPVGVCLNVYVTTDMSLYSAIRLSREKNDGKENNGLNEAILSFLHDLPPVEVTDSPRIAWIRYQLVFNDNSSKFSLQY